MSDSSIGDVKGDDENVGSSACDIVRCRKQIDSKGRGSRKQRRNAEDARHAATVGGGTGPEPDRGGRR